ncbi:glycogen debranching protein GlgX [Oerskovia sp. Root22]|uniref:glycogen debranching protein GlgX n=1 Tax=Oerskovia sp. Root22 TaxID=1736494 RepID=UPI0006FA572F|nr:glycogen debranching protein GlgX [Oerskovia sp. Root22]KRC34075.1 glycogen debranching protein [Oerskovia sp. Root22]
MQALAPTPRPRPSHGPVPPFGVHLAGDGVDVAVLASHASAVDLCLLDVSPDGEIHERRVALDGPSYGVWHARVPGVREGQRYGFRAHGPWDPAAGLRYNPAKLLLDPYARGLVGELDEDPSTRGHVTERDASGVLVGDPEGPADPRDSAAHVPHSVVVAPRTNHPPVRRPQVPWADTVLYEAHVRGLTMQLEAVPEPLRGTYAGLAHPATIAHLRDLGVTTIELLPIHAFLSEPHLVAQGLTNYWGYSTAGFFAPHAPYATRDAQEAGPGAVVDEVRGMVHLLHEAGIEVVLDVVHNHTCEGGVDGPHLSWRGLDNPVHYLHDGATPARLADVTGTGNSLDFRRARVVQATLDSLRYWAQEIGVDGFRFDLAVTLGRGPGGFDPDHPFLVALQTDPVLNGLKLIAEPWDVGPGGWRTGQFPAPLAEWNDRFRGAVRQFWLADPREASHGRLGQGVRELATRLAGSADLFGHSDPPLMRGPVASINFVTAHDGFTLADLVAYEHKHNEANGEGNRDGSDDNRSWNHGIEGRLSDEDATIRGLEHEGFEPGLVIAPLRRRSIRNLMATQILAAGTPMLTAGDEMGRTQRGNNNAYCQDGPLSWVSWDLSPWRKDLLATTTHLLALRREHAALRSDAFFHGRPRHAAEDAVPDLAWFDAAGRPLDHDAWHDPGFRVLQMLRTGPGEGDKDVLVVVNGALDTVEVTPAAVPGRGEDRAAGCAWELAWDSDWEHPTEGEHGVDGLEDGGGGEGTASADRAPADRAPADQADQADPADSPSVLLEPLSMQVYVSAERP